ncbi:MAG TPA: DNA internalization-related competence protein ComEC/Rec2 [Hydrogenispora sp.]|nr:DNA internalization-related competence protein ComEC/Rec2 [Hydrogenispora sp.]
MISRCPLLWAPFFLGGGIITGWYGRHWSAAVLLLLIFGLLLFLGGWRLRRRQGTGLLLFLLIGVILGGAEAKLHLRHRAVLADHQGQLVALVGTVLETPAPWRDGLRFAFRVETFHGVDLTVQPKVEVFLPTPGAYHYGQRLALRGRLFGDDQRAGSVWVRERITGGLLVEGQPVEHGNGKVSLVGRLVNAGQRRLIAVGEATLPPRAATILHGMLMGRREPGLSALTFERVGVAHLLSVSGLHLTFWLSLFWGLGKALRLPDRVLGVLAVPAVVLFLLVAGGGAPALRAGIMGLLALFGDLTQRRTHRPLHLAIAAVMILLLRPLEIFAFGFWLSFAACVGLLVVYPRWEQSWAAYPMFAKGRPFFLSLAAQMMVAPLIAKVYGGFSLVAPLANLILVPLAGLAVQIGLVAALSGLVFLPLARLLNAGNAVILDGFWQLTIFLASWPGYLRFPPWPWLTVGATYGVIFLLTWGMTVNPVTKKRRLPLFYILLILAVIGLVVTGYYLVQDLKPCLELVFFDVGQGDALLISAPGDYHILVDGGEMGAYAREIRPYLQAQGIRALDLVVVTHPHEDHLGGVVRLLEDGRIEVAQILESGYTHTTRLYERFLTLTQERGIPLRQAVEGTTLQVGALKGLVLHPPPTPWTGVDLNNNSLVLLLDWHSVRILLTGDVEDLGEARLLAEYGDGLRANLLKVGHHGSATGTGRAWLQKVQPELAVISVGAGNSFGHPEPVVLSRLDEAGARVYRTDQRGRLTFRIRPARRGGPAQIEVQSEVRR